MNRSLFHSLYHQHYGFMTCASMDYWRNSAGVLFGTFMDHAGTIVNLPLSEVEVLTIARMY